MYLVTVLNQTFTCAAGGVFSLVFLARSAYDGSLLASGSPDAQAFSVQAIAYVPQEQELMPTPAAKILPEVVDQETPLLSGKFSADIDFTSLTDAQYVIRILYKNTILWQQDITLIPAIQVP